MALTVSLVLVTGIAILIVVGVQQNKLQDFFGREIESLAMKEAEKTAQDIYLMVQAMQESVSQTVENNLRVADEVFKTMGEITFDADTVPWTAFNQFTNEKQTVELAKLTVGGQWLGQNTSFSTPTPVVDRVAELVGGTTTVFQRMNRAGDMLRVATNVRKKDGTRAVGTYIPALNPDGSANPVIKTVLGGKTYRGLAFVVDAWYVTAYQPIWNAGRNHVVGIIYYGQKQESISSLRQGVLNTKVGSNGQVYILGAGGQDEGRYLITRDTAKDGKTGLQDTDQNQKPYIRSFLEKASTLVGKATGGAIPVAFDRYQLKDQKDNRIHTKEVAITYFEPWKWVIVAELDKADLAATLEQLNESFKKAIYLIIGIAILMLLIAVPCAYFFARGIGVPLQKTVNMIDALQQGILDQRLNMTRSDEVGRMAKALDAFADNLQNEILTAFQKLAAGDFTFEATGLIRKPLADANARLNEVMAQVQINSRQISAAAGQISDASQTLSQSATEQASSLEEIGSSMTEINSRTQNNAEHAQQASHFSMQAREAADKGNQQMREMIKAMEEINISGQNISKIIKVIDEIAFQTNLLALNAAVEAARAGQHGKGFAVVAEEVRNLAARSAKAAQETAGLIENSVKKAENGMEIARRTGSAFQEIVGGIGKTTDLVTEIAAGSKEQAQGIAQINQGLHQIENVTQQNTASAEESAAASEELAGQAEMLKRLVEGFRLAEAGRQTALD
ncbi:MAG: Cache 3/Cache 2 fusion domain-containing protein [Deltaproteobacteria bacterium]|nr:Cache 3/Cache 2 fusion domain-containing protein [Deltaproteobacteria bacterium]